MNRLLICCALIAACNAAPANSDAPPPAWLVGKYHFEGNGNVANKFPWNAKADLLLDHDGQYTMSIAVHVDDKKGGDTDTDESYGTYYLDGDRVILEPANGNDDQSRNELEVQGKKLVWRLPWAARIAFKGFHIPDPVLVKTE